MPLISRQKQIPGGFKFYQPEIKWQSPPWSSFQIIVDNLIAARKAHPQMCAKYGWSTDPNVVADEVDAFQTRICQHMGWSDYVANAAPPPPPSFLPAPTADQSKLAAAGAAVRKIWAGVRTVDDWFEAGAPAVPAQQAASRAAVCVDCTKHGKGDFTTWFSKPAAAAIQRHVEKAKGMNLSTPHDDKLNVCEVCLCPMKLKCHFPIEIIKTHLKDDVIADLKSAPACWIITELSGG